MSILRLHGYMKNIEGADELRQVICDYYARRVDSEFDKLWESGALIIMILLEANLGR